MNTISPARSAATGAAEIEYETVTTPVLVVGAGAAGARTAIALADHGIEPLVVGKRDHGDAHTTWAAGGINAALGTHDPEDSWAIHAADTLKEGHFLNDPVAVETVTKAMPDRLRELADWGTEFARTEEGGIDQRYFGAQSYRRTCFVGDRTGEAMLDTLVEQAQAREIPYRENVMVTKLLADEGRVHGAVGYDMDDGHFVLFRTDHVVLAAGGFSALWSRHSSREDENTGDGPALAYDAGAALMDVEFVQFHPTGMVAEEGWDEDWNGRLVTEAVRGEGGRLFNAEGERFMERYSPDQMELDARDVVARAIQSEVDAGRGTENGGVYLDISHRDRDFIRERLPRMYERFQDLGVDLAEEPVEIAPTTHYTMGGVDVDFRTGETGVDGLYAVGETTAGVHGANRLGGNSLAETVALGKIVGDHVATDYAPAAPAGDLSAAVTEQAREHFERLDALATADGDESPRELIDELGELLWTHAGIRRDADSLVAGRAKLGALRERARDLRVAGDRTSLAFEYAVDLGFMFTMAEAVLRTAERRTESRGAHYRSDHPETDPALRKNVLAFADDHDHMTLATRDVARPGDEVQQALDEGHELDYHHLE
jgi:succinate dehydrogenase / fumarate reductase flavoprotein subunit